MKTQEKPKFIMVRAMSQSEEDFNIFFKNSIVAVGWSQVDFTHYSDLNDLANAVKEKYYSDGKTVPRVISKKINEVIRFKTFYNDDRVIVPYYSSICLAEATHQEKYDRSQLDADLANQRLVRFLCKTGDNRPALLPRDVLSEGLQRRLRVRGSTVTDLYEFSDELEGIWKRFIPEKGFIDAGWSPEFEKKNQKAMIEFKGMILKNIQYGHTNLKAGGIGLEHLVEELLEIEGYQSEILPKQFAKGIADVDIRATKTDRLIDTTLLIQVKHHQGMSDTWGANQLLETINNEKFKNDGYEKLVLVTSADATKELKEKCNDNDIILIVGSDLADWIMESLMKLRSETKRKLGISDVPRLL
jgi:restriction system protein